MIPRQFMRHGVHAVYVLLVLWVLGYCLLHILDKKSKYASVVQAGASRNVFDGYKLHRLSFAGWFQDEYDEKLDTKKGNPEQTSLNISESILNSLRITPSTLLPPVDSCLSIIQGSETALEEVKLTALQMRSKSFEPSKRKLETWNDDVVAMASNCTSFKATRQYIPTPLTPEEKAYPIAYIITIHNNVGSFERLLRSIYHPQNLYCIHVDKKSPEKFLESIRRITGCLANAFVASRLTEVHYSHYSRLKADLNCLQDLAERHSQVPWKYVINLCGQDFPLKSNLDMTRALKNLHGFNNLETFATPSHKKQRFLFKYELPSGDTNQHETMKKTKVTKSPSPLDTPMFSGSAYYIFKFAAVQFILSDPRVAKFLSWNQDTYSPDEHVWGTLQRWYPIFPGSFPPHGKYDLNELQSITRLVKWGGLDTAVYPKCAGVYVRGVCVYGSGDLSWLVQQHHLFANKFDAGVDPYAVECLDQWVRNRTISQSLKYLTYGYV